MQTEQLIRSLVTDLAPVRRLRAPGLRAVSFLSVVALLGGVLVLCFADLATFATRMASTRTAMDCVATALTAIAATWAAFERSVPGNSPRWAWLPLPTFLVWLGASGLGCLHNGWSLHGPGGFVGESSHCVLFILAASVPLALGLFWMLRRAHPVTPLPVAVLATLAVSATAAFLLQFFHPFDVTVIDITLHLAAIGIVMLLGTLWRRALLAPG